MFTLGVYVKWNNKLWKFFLGITSTWIILEKA